MNERPPPLFPRPVQGVVLVLVAVVLTLWGYHAWSAVRISQRTLHLRTHAPVDLNSCTLAELELLPGVGKTLAERIEAYRASNGGFHDVAELLEVHGIGPITFERLKPLVQIGPTRAGTATPVAFVGDLSVKKLPPGTTLDPNTATVDLIERVPGLGKTLAARVVEARDVAPFRSVDELRRVRGIGPKTLESARPYFRIGGTP